jgi:uncharacterized phage protein gp47/JayE
MPDTLDANGLTIKTLTEIVAELEAGMQTVYGTDINVDPDSPDGQMINMFAQACIDLREVIEDIYTSMDPDQATGVVLDQRVAINGIMRNGGTYTVAPVEITVDRAVSLIGLDTLSDALEADFPAGVYTVKDDAGTQFVLLDSVNIAAAGTATYDFRAVNIGAVLVEVGTITTPVTVIAGVTAIANASATSVQGVDEESDTALKIRRRKSTAIASEGYLDSIESNILALDGVTACVVDENVTNVTDANGTPAHYIWAIVEGGADADIAEAIYATKSSGSGMRGVTVVSVARPNGRTIDISFDRPTDEDLYIRFNVVEKNGGVIDTANLAALIVENIIYNVGDSASADDITAYVKSVNTNYRVTAMEVSANGSSWYEVVAPTAVNYKFVLSTARITIT